MLFIGGVQQNLFIWSLADFGMGLMTVVNLIGIIGLSKEVIESLADYESKMLKGKELNKGLRTSKV